MDKTYFLTGVTGYLGSKLLRRLEQMGGNFYCLKRKTSDLYRVKDLESRIFWLDLEEFKIESFFAKNHVDCIIHCATDYGRKAINPFETIEANLLLPLRLLHHGAIAGVTTFINTDTVLDKNIDTYSLSKNQFLDWFKKYSNRISAINIALQHFYGTGDDPTKFTTHIIQSLINSEKRLKLTAGHQRRDFIYIDDVVDAFIKIMETSSSMKRGYHTFEIGTGTPVTIMEFINLAKVLAKNTTTILDFGALPYRPGEVMDIETNIKKLLNLGWQNRFDLELGLSLTINAERLENG